MCKVAPGTAPCACWAVLRVPRTAVPGLGTGGRARPTKRWTLQGEGCGIGGGMPPLSAARLVWPVLPMVVGARRVASGSAVRGAVNHGRSTLRSETAAVVRLVPTTPTVLPTSRPLLPLLWLTALLQLPVVAEPEARGLAPACPREAELGRDVGCVAAQDGCGGGNVYTDEPGAGMERREA